MAEPIARASGEGFDPSSSAAEASSPGETIPEGTGQTITEAKSLVRDVADTQRRKVADALGGMAQALHRTAQDIDSESKSMARYTDMAAERLEQVSRYLRQAHWNDIVDETVDFARRQPWWFIGGAAAAGFILARAVKGSLPKGGGEPAVAGTAELGGSAAAPHPAGSTVTAPAGEGS
ncbi:MAG: hypothetical protein M0006_04270 [Magnetospirillum sp.]|nr:hypothetical protein [Magnetospirillum sp.]